MSFQGSQALYNICNGHTALKQNWTLRRRNQGWQQGHPCSRNQSPGLVVIWDISCLDLFDFWTNFAFFFSLLDQAVLSNSPGEK